MTHAHVTPNTPILCNVAFDYDEEIKNRVKELAGATYAGGLWTVSILHLPTLKTIFKTMTVDPAVVTAYHTLLKTMLQQFGGCLPDTMAYTHANGIAAVYKSGWKPTERPQPPLTPHTAPLPPIVQSTRPASIQADVEIDPGMDLWFRGVQNAIKRKKKQAAIVRNRKR